MAITPWEIGDQFARMLAAQAGRDQQIGANAQDNIMQAEIARQNANTAYGRALSKDQLNYEQQLARDQANRDFVHAENYNKGVTYKKGAGGGRFATLNPDVTQAGAPSTSVTTTGRASDASGRVTAQSAYTYLTGQGIPPKVAAGIVGNIDVESAGFDPAVFSGTNRGDQGTAFGAGQWRGDRQANLFSFAQSRGHDRPTPEDQLDFFTQEAKTGSDPGARRAFELAAAAATPEEAAAAIMQHYERPRDLSSLNRRQSAARAIYGAGGAGTEPTTVAAPRRYVDPMVQPVAAPAASVDPTADPLQTAMQEARQPPAQPPAAAPDEEGGGDAPDAATESTEIQPTPQKVPPGTPLRDTPMVPLTDQQLAAGNITSFDMRAVPEGKDVVGTRFFSAQTYANMPSEIRDYVVPLGALDAHGTNEFLILQDKPPNSTDENGDPIYDPEVAKQQAAATQAAPVTPPPAPAASTQVQAPAPPPPQPTQIVQGTPTQPVSQAVPTTDTTTGQRTRRNAQGELEFLVGGQWRASGA